MNIKSPLTTWHALASIAAFVLVGVGGKMIGLPDTLTPILATGVALLLQSLGLIQAGDAASLEKTASDFSSQLNNGIAAVKADMVALHNQSVAADLVLHTAVAVQAATVGAPPPAPLIVPTVAPAAPTVETPHLVS